MERVYEKLCFECRACEQICPKHAISMCEDYEGFCYPVIDPNNCIDCGLCNKVCPGNHPNELKHKHLHVYAVQIKDEETLLHSSSGGLFTLFSEYILEKGGIVYGAAFDENMNCHHIGVTDVSQLSALRGSKYVHSDIRNSFIEIREHLKSGRIVYFTGTPCQVAGLKLFLRQDYDNLLTSDLICHGTPSQKLFSLFVRGMEEDVGKKIIGWDFRDKTLCGWSCTSSSSSIDAKGKRSHHIANLNMTAYFQAFIRGHAFRMDCYECPFACSERVGDFTIGDYWGIKKIHPDFPNRKKGVSMLIINNKKANDIWEDLNERTIWMKSKMEYALSTSNRNLKQPSILPRERKDAYSKAFSDYKKFCNSYKDAYHRNRLYKTYYINLFKKTRIGKLLYQILKGKKL